MITGGMIPKVENCVDAVRRRREGGGDPRRPAAACLPARAVHRGRARDADPGVGDKKQARRENPPGLATRSRSASGLRHRRQFLDQMDLLAQQLAIRAGPVGEHPSANRRRSPGRRPSPRCGRSCAAWRAGARSRSRCARRIRWSSAAWIACSLSESSALVASSSSRIGASLQQRPRDRQPLPLPARELHAAVADHACRTRPAAPR